MKKNLIAGLALLFLFHAVYSQTGAISSSISTASAPIFIQGVEGFENVLTVSGAPQSQEVWFCQFDANDEVLDSTEAMEDNGEWIDTLDMGDMDSMAVRIVAHYYDSQNDYIGFSDPYEFTIKPKPEAIKSEIVDISVESIDANGIAALEITISVPDSTEPVNDDVIGIGGKKFGLETNEIVIKRDYDINTGIVAAGTDNSYNYQINAFGREVTSDEIPLTGFTNLNIDVDTDFNPVIEGHFNARKHFFEFKTRDITLPLPITPASISVGAGISLDGGFAADCYLGIDNNTGDFGFIQKQNGERTTVSFGAKIKGSIWATGSLVSKHLAGVRASLTAIGRIGASYEFQTVPSFQSEFLFGGDIQVTGKVELTGLSGKAKKLWCSYNPFTSCEPNSTVLDGVIWPRNPNDTPKSFGGGLPGNLDTLMASGMGFYTDYHSRSQLVDSNYLFDIPDDNPQPAFANRGSAIAITWIESDSSNQHLLFSLLDTLQNKFTLPLEIAENDVLLADSKVALAPDGSAIIVWTQSNLLADDIDANTNIDKLIDALEVWYAVYDPISASITTKSKIYNPIEFPASKPGIAISDSGKALISWLAEDTASSYTDIWYAELVNDNGIWYQSTPDIINDLPGNNYNVNICFSDSVNAIAAWITDEDGDDSTGGNKIVVSYYDGDSWSNTTDLSEENAEEEYNELSMDFNGDYGAVAYTSTTYTEEGEQINSLKAEFYYQGQWDEVNYYEHSDSLSYVRMPRVSISNDEFAAISYQTVDLYSESGEADAGEIHIALKDLNSAAGWDSIDFSAQIAQDSSIFVWDMDVVLGRNNTLYTLSQENDTVIQEIYGGQYTPRTGSTFGDASIGLVLRGLKINPDLSIDSVSVLPETPTGLPQILANPSESLRLFVYPNPFKDNTTIEYSIPENGLTSLEVFDLMGRSCTPLINQFLNAGSYKVSFMDNGMAPGVYLLRISCNENLKICKLVVK